MASEKLVSFQIELNKICSSMREKRIRSVLIYFNNKAILPYNEKNLKERLESLLNKQIRNNSEIDELLDEIFDEVQLPANSFIN